MPAWVATVIDTQKGAREVRDLPFCYLCGVKFDADSTNHDHVPPKRLFLKGHRDFPLLLKTHVKCNGDRSGEDQIITQLIGVLHDRHIDTHEGGKLQVDMGRMEDGSPVLAAKSLPLRAIIRRWLRGFHAALYREFLPHDVNAMISPPLPEGSLRGDVATPIALPAAVPEIVEAIKVNRRAGTLDRVACRKGKCRYECVWVRAQNGGRMCFFALDLYDWKLLGDRRAEQRGCVGAYWRETGRAPEGAAYGTEIEIVGGIGGAPLDPFSTS